MEEKEFLTVKEAAECLRVSPKTIYGMVKRGDLRFYSARRRLYFRRKDINALLTWQQQIGTDAGYHELIKNSFDIIIEGTVEDTVLESV